MQKGTFLNFRHFDGYLGFLRKMKSVNILETVTDGAISSKFSTHRVVQECHGKGKNFNFCHFWRPSWILAENEKCEYLEKP